LREYGTKSFGEVVQPAIELADGWPIDELRWNYIERTQKFMIRWPSSQKVFLPGGRVPQPGEIFRQPDLARTLRSMVEAEKRALSGGASRAVASNAVHDYFYKGDIARRIDEFSKANDGLLRYEDLASFRVEPEDAVSTTYRGYTVYKPGFWSQGPVLIETLNILERFDVKAMQLNSADYIHTLDEALKLAYADRDVYYGDPKFNRIPMSRLLSKEYGVERSKLIASTASFEFRPGLIDGKTPRHPSEERIEKAKLDDALLAKDTTCVDVVDKDGAAFSATPSGAWLPSV